MSLNEYYKNRPELSGVDFRNIKVKRKETVYNNTMNLEVSQYIFKCCEKIVHKNKDFKSGLNRIE